MQGWSMPTAVDRQGHPGLAHWPQIKDFHHRHSDDGPQDRHRRNARTVRAGLALTAVRSTNHEVRGVTNVGAVAVLDGRHAGECTHGRREAIGMQGQQHLRPQQRSDRQERNTGTQASAAEGIHPDRQSSAR